MIKTFLFDLGNVLVTFCHRRMLGQIGALCGHDEQSLRPLLFGTGLLDRFETGQLTEETFLREAERLLHCTFEPTALYQASCDIFAANDPMPALTRQLKQAGYRLVLLSNTNAGHLRFVRESFDVLEPFDELVLSYEVGAMKPDERIFAAARRAIGCQPEECFYTDDIPRYVEAGRAAGLDAEVFTTADAFRRQLADRGIVLDG